MSARFLTQAECEDIRRGLDAAVLNVALLAASLQVSRRLEVRVNARGRFEIRFAGERRTILTAASRSVAERFLDNFGVDA